MHELSLQNAIAVLPEHRRLDRKKRYTDEQETLQTSQKEGVCHILTLLCWNQIYKVILVILI